MRRAGRVAIDTLGCRLNQAETESIARDFLERGYELRRVDEGVDIYVLNTCTVTHIADRKSRHLLRLARRINPSALLIATGCYAERAPNELAEAGANLVVGNDEKGHLAEMLPSYLHPHPSPLPSRERELGVGRHGFRTRALVKIQEGCRSYCSFCIVPRVRGPERSIPVDWVIDEVRARVASGYKEVVLTGTKIGAYGGDGVGLEHLVEHILSETGVKRLRLSSLQPQDLVPSLIEMWADQRLCRHFHISLQSGSDPVLRRMGRNYSVADYEWAVSLVRKTIPGVAITTDVIVGFPGESAEEFEENCQFCRKMSFARIHVFPYSARVGTAASKMPHQVEDRIKRERCQRMIELARESARNFREQFLGEMAEVLWERQVGESWSGLTDNYIRVFTLSNEALNNRLASVRLLSQLKEGLLGSLTPS